MGSFDPMEVGRRKNESSRPVHRLDEPTGNIPRHGCVPAEPASVSPGKIIVAPATTCRFSTLQQLFRHPKCGVAVERRVMTETMSLLAPVGTGRNW